MLLPLGPWYLLPLQSVQQHASAEHKSLTTCLRRLVDSTTVGQCTAYVGVAVPATQAADEAAAACFETNMMVRLSATLYDAATQLWEFKQVGRDGPYI